jgi:hypothetical protein
MDDKLALATARHEELVLSYQRSWPTKAMTLFIASAGERLNGATEEIRGRGHQMIEVTADLATREGVVDQLWAQVQSLGRPIEIACINCMSRRRRSFQ